LGQGFHRPELQEKVSTVNPVYGNKEEGANGVLDYGAPLFVKYSLYICVM
jgi:hypothetical protein